MDKPLFLARDTSTVQNTETLSTIEANNEERITVFTEVATRHQLAGSRGVSA